MLPNLTPATMRALAAARLWAERMEEEDPGPIHILLGLLEEDEGRIATVLATHGLSSSAIRKQLLGHDTSMSLQIVEVPDDGILRRGVHRVLRSAKRLAEEWAGEDTIATEHLLLALLRYDDALRSSLEEIGLNVPILELELGYDTSPVPMDEPIDFTITHQPIDSARIMDANLNRAREALRVVEEYCRFVLDDCLLTEELKRMRHELSHALTALPSGLLLQSRDTLGDVGTSIGTETEYRRASILDTVQANLKRLQEALRVLEEYGKLHPGELAVHLEQLRYRSYTLERAIVLGTGARQRLHEAQLYFLVTGSQCVRSLEATVKDALAGGVQVVQLREKLLNDRDLLARARDVCRWTKQAGGLFIMNDRPDLARLADADGVHLGQEELGVQDARKLLGSSAIVGVSTHNVRQLRQALLDGATYLGIGPTFSSRTKQFESLAGLSFVREAAELTSLPTFAIGGITLDNVGEVIQAGLRRVAVSHSICQAESPAALAKTFRQALAR